jgi:hypothetical protein
MNASTPNNEQIHFAHRRSFTATNNGTKADLKRDWLKHLTTCKPCAEHEATTR